ncbi:Zn-ribbon domain-containing OB-fold protein [Tardiphaga sp.]|jgi:uncharacterized OB-fold protein|uniref:Zn-ribbon domain-containing OB-fold protein n=1 Tax=Tardiphaga sp. TaxID=1926292 RepID=UPI0037D9C9E9
MTLKIVSIDKLRAYPPRISEFTSRFWSALDKGILETTRCDACERFSFPPKPICPHCWSTTISWAGLIGTGRLYSQTVIHVPPAVFKQESPYRVGIVDLDQGVRLATKILSDDPLPLDSAVQLLVLRYRDGPLFAAEAC